MIIADTLGSHAFLLPSYSAETFRCINGNTNLHYGCFGNLSEALFVYGIEPDVWNVEACDNTDQLKTRIL